MYLDTAMIDNKCCKEKRVFVGSDVKFRVTITADGFSQDTDNWDVTITRGSTSHTYAKADCIQAIDGWYVAFNTADFGAGRYTATIAAYIPDTDFPDGTRKEVKRIEFLLVEP